MRFYVILIFLIMTIGDFAQQLHADEQPAFPCASEGESCQLPPNNTRYTVSYGADKGFFYVTVENISAVFCSQLFFGTVAAKDQKCMAIPAKPIEQESTWRHCANAEGGDCEVKLNKGEYVLARYGDPKTSRWIYNYVATDFTCNLYSFGYGAPQSVGVPYGIAGSAMASALLDPAPGVAKTCEITRPINTISTRSGQPAEWRTCGTAGSDCPLPSEGTYIVRFGVDTRWLYREFNGTSFPCNLSSFGYDKALGVHKSCQYLASPQIKSFNGYWEKLIRCEGCPSETFSYTEGVEKGKAKELTSSWSVELSLTLEQSAGVEGVSSSKVSSTLSTTTGGAKSIAESFTKNVDKTLQVPCDKGALYQWVTSVENFCGPNSSDCTTVARATEFKCTTISDVPNLNKRVALTAEEKADFKTRFPGKTAPAERLFWGAP